MKIKSILTFLIILFSIIILNAQNLNGKRIALFKLETEMHGSIFEVLDKNKKSLNGAEKFSYDVVKIATQEKFREKIIPKWQTVIKNTPLEIQSIDVFRNKIKYDNAGVPKINSLKKRILKKNLTEEADLFIQLHYRFNLIAEKAKYIKPQGQFNMIVFDHTGTQIEEFSVEVVSDKEISSKEFVLDGKEFDRTKVHHIDTLVNYLLPLGEQLHERLIEKLGYAKTDKSSKVIASNPVSSKISSSDITIKKVNNNRPARTKFYSLESALDSPDQVIELILNNDSLYELPKEFVGFKKIEKLYLKGNKLDRIPEFVSTLNTLKYLTIINNNVETIPEWLNELSNLEVLILENNPISNSDFDISNLKKLRTLELKGCNLEYFPISILELENLEKLDLAGNKISELPLDLGRLKSLKFFILGSSKYLNSNSFSQIPIQISDLKNLQNLWLDNLEYKYVPKEILEMQKLVVIRLDENLPKELLQEYGRTYKMKMIRTDKRW